MEEPPVPVPLLRVIQVRPNEEDPVDDVDMGQLLDDAAPHPQQPPVDKSVSQWRRKSWRLDILFYQILLTVS
jgi:hypothetical protein